MIKKNSSQKKIKKKQKISPYKEDKDLKTEIVRKTTK